MKPKAVAAPIIVKTRSMVEDTAFAERIGRSKSFTASQRKLLVPSESVRDLAPSNEIDLSEEEAELEDLEQEERVLEEEEHELEREQEEHMTRVRASSSR